MKKLPYGILNYKELREEEYLYVDKTMYLEKLEFVDDIVLFTRPRTFGKSLFTSMLYYYYDVNSECLFEPLFGSTYVYKNPTPYKNSYFVLKFDFSGISTSKVIDFEDLRVSFVKCIATGIKSFLTHYDLEYEIDEKDKPENILKDFFSFYEHLKLEYKLYILIDEYDNFTNAILDGDGKDFIDVVGNNGFVKGFYATIKIFVGMGLVDRVFITGICPITLDSMTTGFNIATDISQDPRFASVIGLTHEEVLNLLSEVEEEKREELYTLMIQNYDGYLFSQEATERIFNATLVMYFLKKYSDFNKIPKDLIDKNLVSNYGKIESLVKLQNNEFYESIIDSTLKMGIVSGELQNNFNLELDFTRDDIISLLYYFGYLTIKSEGIGNKLIFSIPNYVMKEMYYKFFLKLLNDIKVTIDDDRKDEYLTELVREGKIDKVTDYVSELLHYMSNRGLQNFSEKDLQVFYFALLFEAKEFHIYTEYESSNGYIDFYLKPNKEYMEYSILIEFKYIKKSDYNEKLFLSKKEAAKSQLTRYAEDERIAKEHLKKYIVLFVGTEVKLIEEV